MAYKYYVDIDMAGNSIDNFAVGSASTAPSTAVSGQMYFNSSDKKLYTYNGSKWVDLTTSAYTLPTASSTVLGGVKVGTNLSINSSGVLSATNTDTKVTQSPVDTTKDNNLNVMFSTIADAGSTEKTSTLCKDSVFVYNPNKHTLSIGSQGVFQGNITGTAAYATKADGDTDTIKNTYATKISVSTAPATIAVTCGALTAGSDGYCVWSISFGTLTTIPNAIVQIYEGSDSDGWTLVNAKVVIDKSTYARARVFFNLSSVASGRFKAVIMYKS